MANNYIKCEKCGEEFEPRSVKCEICSKLRGEPTYELYSNKCDNCLEKNDALVSGYENEE